MVDPLKKSAVVVHSGGMDSSICLALAIEEFGKDQVLSLGFDYGQRHAAPELEAARKICSDWGVDRLVLPVRCLAQITDDALVNHRMEISKDSEEVNTLVVGRNGLMARLAAIHAHSLGASVVSMGVMGLEEANSGYRDCSRDYMDLMEKILRIDLGDKDFELRTPLVHMTKCETLQLAEKLGQVEYLLETTITCYEGLSGEGCGMCPACLLRNAGLREYRLLVAQN